MAFVDKNLLIYAIAGKAEATFGVENAPDMTVDAFYPQFSGTDMPELLGESFEFDGDLGVNSAGNAPNPNVAPSGRSGDIDVPSYWWGAPAAFSSSVTPKNNIHAAMKAMGYIATGTFTAGSEKWVYQQAANSVTPTSMTLNAWASQVNGTGNLELVKMLAGVGSLKMAFTDAKPPIFTFGFKGVYPVDVAEAAFTPPTITRTPLPALSSNCSISYGAFSTANLYDGDFDLARTLDPRAPLNNANAHLGYIPRGHKPVLNVTIERSKLASFNPWAIRAAASTAALNLTFGSTQYNIVALDAAQAQIVGIKNTNKGGIACWQLSFLLPASTAAGTDSHTWTAK